MTRAHGHDVDIAADRHRLDYDIDDDVVVDRPDALKKLFDETRLVILSMLLDRAATTTQLAEALDKPKGTVGYHLKVLEEIGVVRVVRTAQVRAMTEKYYGRVGRTIMYAGLPEGADRAFMLRRAIDEMAFPEVGKLPAFTVRHARIPEERALEFAERVWDLAMDFSELPRSGEVVYGFVAGVYPTILPALQDGDETPS